VLELERELELELDSDELEDGLELDSLLVETERFDGLYLSLFFDIVTPRF
jgi:hypothetical protein